MKKLLLPVLLLCALPATAQNSTTLARASTLLKKVPPRATLAQIKKLMPKGTRWDTPSSTSTSGWNFIAQPFRGPLNGQFIFANQRKGPLRKPGAPPPPPFAQTPLLRAGDGFHYAEIFLGTPLLSEKRGALTDFTQRYLTALRGPLGKPVKLKHTGETGAPDAEGWTAQWRFPGKRTIEFYNTFPLLNDGPRPLLILHFPYSKIYKA